jgi:hypothetical protein
VSVYLIVSVIFGIFVKSSMKLQKQNCICIIKREKIGRREKRRTAYVFCV